MNIFLYLKENIIFKFIERIFSNFLIIFSFFLALILSNFTNSFYNSIINFNFFNYYDNNINTTKLINNFLMTIFFFMVGIEIKYEILKGELNNYKKAILPIIAAFGGVLGPAIIYISIIHRNEVFLKGWAIPTVTDIAFATGILTLLDKRVPKSLRSFILALSIIDDLGATLIITLFYKHKLMYFPIIASVITIIIMIVFNLFGINKINLYILASIILWIFIAYSGIHPAISGVVSGIIVPTNLSHKKRNLSVITLKNKIEFWIKNFILPMFIFVNSGISIKDSSINNNDYLLPLGIALGLFIGKPVGISLLIILAVKLNISKLPKNIKLNQILSSTIICGIGFTMSIFITDLAFNEYLSNIAKIGVLIGSLLSALIGYIILKKNLNKQETLKINF